MCFVTSWKLTVLAATLIGPVIYVTRLYSQWSRKINMKIRTSLADSNAVATEAMKNIRTVRSFGATEVELSQFRQHINTALGYATKDAYASAGVSAATKYLNFAATVLILWYGGLTVLHTTSATGMPDLTIGQLITFNLYWDMMSNSIQGINGVLNMLIRAASAAQRVFEIIDLEPDIKMDDGLPIDVAGPYEIQFRDVYFTYQMRPEKVVLNGLSFTISPGQTVAVVGRSGGGKSTLVSLLLRFYDPQGGCVLVNGRPLSECRLRDHQRRVGVVAQETQIFCRSIMDNLTYGLPRDDVSDEAVHKAARMANAHEFIESMDQGYKSMVGEGGVRLSGGQKQRLAIARALLRSPSLLLLDEATSALDAENEGQVQEALDELIKSTAGSCSAMIIAHRLSTVLNADKIVVVDAGQVAEQGSHVQLLQNDAIYAQLVKRQLTSEANAIVENDTSPDDVSKSKGKGKRGSKGKAKGKGNAGDGKHKDVKSVPADSIDGLFKETVSEMKPSTCSGEGTMISSTEITAVVSRGGIDEGHGLDDEELRAPQSLTQKCFKQRAACAAMLVLVIGDIIASVALASKGQVLFVLLLLFRLVYIGWGFILGVKLGTGAWNCEFRCCCFRSLRSAEDVAGGARSLALQQQSAVSSPTCSCAATHPSTSASLGAVRMEANLERIRDAELTRRTASWKRNAVLSFCFVCVTSQSIYTSTSVISATSLGLGEVCCLVATVACMNLQFLVLKHLVDVLTRDDGVLLPALHEHTLYFNQRVSVAWCKICRERIGPKTGGYEGFECLECDGGFWLCVPCYRKHQSKTNTEEGILRSDKGPRPTLHLTAWEYFTRGLKLMRPFQGTLIMALVSVLLSTMAQVFMPSYRGNVINALVEDDPTVFSQQLTIFVILSLASSILGAVQSLTSSLVQRSVTYDTRRVMFESLLRQDIVFYDGTTTGQLTSRMTNDVAVLVQPVQQVLNTFLVNLLKLVGGTFMCFHTSWRLTVLCATLVGPIIYLTRLYAHWSREINKKIRVSMADANSVATEGLRNIRTVRTFGADGTELDEFQQHMDIASGMAKKDAFASAGVSAVTGYLNFATTVLILWYGGLSVLRTSGQGTHSELNIGALITYNLYWDMMTNSIQGLSGMLNSLIRAASAAQRVFEVIDLVPDISIEDGDDLPSQPYFIEFRDVHFAYQMRPEKLVLNGLSFTIPAGQTVAVVGRSGAGKSTLVSLLLRFYDPQRGCILLNGRPLNEWRLRDHQKQVGVVSQETQIFCRPILENLTYGLPPEETNEENIVQVARMANAHSFIEEMDQGYKSMVGEGGVRLSGGQKQRIAIARALLRRPSLLLLDEATSALDAENEGQVQQALDELVRSMAGRCSVMLIAHRLSTVMTADKIVLVDGGRVVEEGTHQELLQNDGIYSKLVTRQLARQANSTGESA